MRNIIAKIAKAAMAAGFLGVMLTASTSQAVPGNGNGICYDCLWSDIRGGGVICASDRGAGSGCQITIMSRIPLIFDCQVLFGPCAPGIGGIAP
jgi:hypothetical protein